jgi:DNA (cytosine-5)-methyltransferase 1
VGHPIRFADLFCGCGALSLGVYEAGRALARGARLEFAADWNLDTLQVLRRSLGINNDVGRQVDLSCALNGAEGHPPTSAEAQLLVPPLSDLDLIVAGPPCQGHSALNNHTRHNDDKNGLYLRVARFAELTKPRYLLIENVSTVTSDKRRAVEDTRNYLERIGYQTDAGLMNLNRLGVPQARQRHVLVAAASGERIISISGVAKLFEVSCPGERTVGWAISDLLDASDGDFNRPSTLSEANATRIAWLHADTTRHDLPNPMRPECHHGDHSYKSMYGKLWWDKPAQTITSGYGSMGQGRYVHPLRQSTLTPHEAARLQQIPDFFQFEAVNKRTAWAEMIGNAAPPKLSYAFALEMFR